MEARLTACTLAASPVRAMEARAGERESSCAATPPDWWGAPPEPRPADLRPREARTLSGSELSRAAVHSASVIMPVPDVLKCANHSARFASETCGLGFGVWGLGLGVLKCTSHSVRGYG
jgi:hypothetical protein